MAETTKAPDDEPRREGRLDATASLLARVRLGDQSALDPLADTDDLVQVTLLRALDHVKELESRHEVATLAYGRRILPSHIRAEVRTATRLPEMKILLRIPIHAATKSGMWVHKIELEGPGL